MSEVAELPVEEKVVEAPPKEKPDLDKEEHTGKAPPHKGPCLRCGRDLMLNRLDLCYRCWVITNLEDAAKKKGEVWTESMAHPDWCKCTGLGEHSNGDGTSRGLN